MKLSINDILTILSTQPPTYLGDLGFTPHGQLGYLIPLHDGVLWTFKVLPFQVSRLTKHDVGEHYLDAIASAIALRLPEAVITAFWAQKVASQMEAL